MPGMFTLSNPLEPDDSLHRVKMLLHVFHCIRADSHGGTLSRPDGHEVVTCAFDSRVKRECIHMQAHTRAFSVVARGHLAISSDLLASPKFRCFDFFHFEERLQTTVSCAAFTEFDFLNFCFDMEERTMTDALLCCEFLSSIEYSASHVVKQQRPTRRSNFVCSDEHFPKSGGSVIDLLLALTNPLLLDMVCEKPL